MATKTKPARIEPQEEPSVQQKIAVELERGSVSVSRDGLTFSISGKNVKLQKQSPLSLTFDSGEVEFDDGEIAVKAEGDAIKLNLD
ncbi:MAG: hypothetical protein ACLP5H_26105 [Desulfomonilaceae bacterium]